MSHRHEVVRRALVRHVCPVCGDIFWERRELPYGETTATYTHEETPCEERCEGVLRFWMTTPVSLPLREFHDKIVWIMWFCHNHGFPRC
jgi:hypothetical protein